MNKYIIKNCPNLSYAIMADGTERNFQCGLEIDEYCQDCTDCVMKQIVDLCKPVKKEYLEHKLDALIAGKFNIAGKILLLLDIQEVE